MGEYMGALMIMIIVAAVGTAIAGTDFDEVGTTFGEEAAAILDDAHQG